MKNIILLIIFVLIFGIVWFNMKEHAGTTTPVETETTQTSDESTAHDEHDMAPEEHAVVEVSGGTDVGMEMPIPDSEIVVDADAKVFEVLGENFAFDIKEIKVKEGDTVVIHFKSVDGFHDWVVDEFNARSAKIQTGGSTQVTFVASKKGVFEYYCSIGSHRAKGMVGKLIVE